MIHKTDPFAGIDCAKDMSPQDKEQLLKEANDTLEAEEVEPSIFIIYGSDITSFLLFTLLFYGLFIFVFRILTQSFL